MDTKALRQKILDLAIRGKLVPQDPNDEPASVLLEKIRAEKQQMVKDGKLKAKDIKDDTVIFVGEDNLHYEKFPDGSVKCIEEEIPFEIPEGWAWCRLRNICIMAAGKSKSKDEIKNEYFIGCYPCYGGNGQRGFVDTYNYEGQHSIVGRQGALCGNVNVAEGKFYATEHAVVVTLYNNIDFYWNTYILEALNLNQYSTGAAQPGLSVANVLNVLVPLPPYKEQLRTAKSLRSCIDIISELYVDKITLQGLIKQAKSKILDLVIRGKLVPQDPNDEPASVLLERIRAEKEELIRQGKIKRDKKESIIFRGEDNSYYEKIGDTVTCIDDDLPFEIPEGWGVLSFSEVNCYISDIIDPSKKLDYKFELYSVPNYDLQQPEIVSGCEIGSTKQQLKVGDVLICKINPRINRVWITGNITDYSKLGSSEWIVFRNRLLNSHYLQIYFSSPFFREKLLSNVSGVGGSLMRAQPDSVKKYPILIPPTSEQIAIINSVSSMYDSLNRIEKSLS